MPSSRKRSSSSSQNVVRGPVAIIFMILVFAIYLYQQYEESGSTGADAPTLTAPAGSVSENTSGSDSGGSDALKVWFTDPLAGASSGGIENNLIDAFDRAQKTIDVAIYNISLTNVGDALLAAHQRGVTVRLVMESTAMDGKVPQALMDGGIEIIGDNRDGLMHNKFVIIDSQEVWMGSMNFTSTSVYKDFNNLVRIRSQRLAQDYEVAFDEMFVEGLFGPKKRANTPYPEVTVNGIPLEVYFSPDDGVTDQIVSEIGQAKESIVFMAYSFTSDPIAAAINQRADEGVTVRGVFDESQNSSNKGGEYDSLKGAGYDVKLDGISGLLHNKVFIIDGKTVITGSFNFSASAENNNDENILIIHNAAIASQYLQAFEPVYNSAK